MNDVCSTTPTLLDIQQYRTYDVRSTFSISVLLAKGDIKPAKESHPAKTFQKLGVDIVKINCQYKLVKR